MAKKDKDAAIDVMTIERGLIEVCVLGTSGIILNRMSEKARRQLLMPPGRKSSAERASSLKHNPMEEYRSAPYVSRDGTAPTYLQGLAVWFKKAMSSCALDIPGTAKAQMDRLLWAEGERIALYGVPQMFMSVVRSADMNRTPDIRTRPILPKWACRVSISYTKPILREQVVANLFAAAGFMRGVGDWRAEKGSAQYGCFKMVNADDPEFLSIIESGGRQAQLQAMQAPAYYDEETEELYEWFLREVVKKGYKLTDLDTSLAELEATGRVHSPKNGHDPEPLPAVLD